MAIPTLPESAPFTVAQRSWLNGFFAGVFGMDQSANSSFFVGGDSTNTGFGITPSLSGVVATEEIEEDFPWHDSNLAIDERLKLAEDQPHKRKLMAALAQLDCGACGYLCRTYSEAIADGEESDLSKCTPGGKETAKKLKELVAANKSLAAQAAANGIGQPLHNGAAKSVTPASVAHGGASAGYSRKNPFPAPLLECRKLTRSGSGKDVRLAVFSLAGSGLTYEVGDALGLMPENDPSLVEEVLKAMRARGDEIVSTPDGTPTHSFDALAKHYAITKIGDELIALLASSASDPADAQALKAFADADSDGVPEGWDLLDLLEQFPSARASAPDLIRTLAPIQPRLYSISSSLKAYPDEVHLTVGVVNYTLERRLRKGVASNFMTETLRTRQKAGVFIHASPGFRLPSNHDAPTIMVGPGTGIAPFRAFLQERAAIGAKGKNWLFFGDQRRDFDFLYEHELESCQKKGILSRLDAAFSRDQAQKIYVQDRMMANAQEIWRWLEDGASFYVCGDAQRMALDVDRALHRIIAEQGSLSPEAAKEYVKEMARSKRYQRDVY